MIVRIATEGQFRLPDADAARLNALDNEAVKAVEAGDEETFHARFEAMLALVREHGVEVADDEIEESHTILPPPDTSFADAAGEFTGEGLIPG